MAKTIVSQYDGTLVKVGERLERFDKGSAIPDHADDDHVAMLKDRGMVAEGEPSTGLTHESVGPVAFDAEAEAKSSRSRSAAKAES